MGKEEIAEPATQPDVEHHLQRRASTAEEADEEILAEFGYKQELRRDWGLMHNFGISFSIIVCSTLTAFVVTSSMGGRGREMCGRC
jgi:hypothetical protein